jgi:hypothetical protein
VVFITSHHFLSFLVGCTASNGTATGGPGPVVLERGYFRLAQHITASPNRLNKLIAS